MRTTCWGVLCAVFAGLVWGCDEEPGSVEPDAAVMDAASGIDAASAGCSEDEDCQDALFCNGVERCAGEATCETAPVGPCGAASCDEAADTCASGSCDGDGDGHDAVECGGDDCDDTDPGRFPDNAEVCDPADRDEDCDPSTFGERDGDGDDAIDARCCNIGPEGPECGPDCDDSDGGAHPSEAESCDGADNDCDGAIDEAVLLVFYRDVDGDAYGVTTMTRMACSAPSGYAFAAGDCDDESAAIHAGVPEVCDVDMVDENCDGTENEGCECVAGQAAACCGGRGVQACIGGAFGPCSVVASDEVCDDVDNDCDGSVDETLPLVTCYPDVDRDGYVDLSAPVMDCACPAGTFLGAPPGDCADLEFIVHPNQRDYFDAASTTNGWDYDCSGTDDREHTIARTCGSTGSCATCYSFPHWLSSNPPDCGETERWGICSCTYDPTSMFTGCTTAEYDFVAQRCH